MLAISGEQTGTHRVCLPVDRQKSRSGIRQAGRRILQELRSEHRQVSFGTGLVSWIEQCANDAYCLQDESWPETAAAEDTAAAAAEAAGAEGAEGAQGTWNRSGDCTDEETWYGYYHGVPD